MSTTPAPAPRILVVDDDPALLDISQRLLACAGYEVSCAPDGGAALHLLRHDHFDLVITDHNMPGMTGLELVRELRAAVPRLPSILMSGRLTFGETESETPNGPDAFLPKPFSFAELVRTVKTLLTPPSFTVAT